MGGGGGAKEGKKLIKYYYMKKYLKLQNQAAPNLLNFSLHQKNETSETTVRNLYGIFTFPCNCKLVRFFAKLLYKPLKNICKASEVI